MDGPADNVRVRRTRKLLRDALIELIEERGFERVTVAEICGRAMVSRAAFYRNYRDKFQLVEQIFDGAVAELLGSIEGTEQSPLDRWVVFFEHIDGYHRFYGALLGRNGSPWFADRMRATLAGMVSEHLPVPEPRTRPQPGPQQGPRTRPPTGPRTDPGPGPAPTRQPAEPVTDLVPTVLAAMSVQAITWWLDNGRPYPPRRIAVRTAQLSAAVITEAQGWATAPPAPEPAGPSAPPASEPAGPSTPSTPSAPE